MPHTPHCDRCGEPIPKGHLRFVTRIQIWAAADTIEIDPAELLDNPRERIKDLLTQCEGLTEEELMQDVFVERQYDLCRPCQRAFLANPFPKS